MSDWSRRATGWLVIALGASMPISTALDNVLLYLLLILSLLAGDFRARWDVLRSDPVARAVMAFIFVLLVGSLHGAGPAMDAINMLGKYIDLLLVLALIPLLHDERTRRYAWNAFLAAMAVTLVLSYLAGFGIYHHNALVAGGPSDPIVFRNHITQNIFMAVFAFLCVVRARFCAIRWMQVAWSVAALLAVYNIVFMVRGRSGYLVLAALALYFAFTFGKRYVTIAVVLTGLVFASVAAYQMSPKVRKNVDEVTQGIEKWSAGHTKRRTSTMQRLDFADDAIDIVLAHPLMGVGVGNFPAAYRALEPDNKKRRPLNNPHSQFLLTAAEVGLIGLAVLLYLFGTQWRVAGRMAPPDRLLARGIIVTVAAGSVVNSLLMDHAEGLFYAWATAVVFAGRASSATGRA